MSGLKDEKSIKSKPTQKLKHANSILDFSEYFRKMSSKLILTILSYTVSKLVHFIWDTVYNYHTVELYQHWYVASHRADTAYRWAWYGMTTVRGEKFMQNMPDKNICVSLIGCICKTSLIPASPIGCDTLSTRSRWLVYSVIGTVVPSAASQKCCSRWRIYLMTHLMIWKFLTRKLVQVTCTSPTWQTWKWRHESCRA